MKKITFTFLAFIAFSIVTMAQDKLTQKEKEEEQIYRGFVVTANHNDTIYGEIQFFNPTFNEMTVVFYKDGERFQYSSVGGEISEYAFQYKRYNKETESLEPFWFVYVRKLVPKSPLKGGAKVVFLERQVRGEITMYNYYTLETSKMSSRDYNHNYFIEKSGIDGFSLVEVTRENYRDIIRSHLVLGNDELEEKLGTVGFGYKYLSTIVALQNAWLNGSPEYYVLLNNAQGKGGYADLND